MGSFKEFNQQNKARAEADKAYTKSVNDLIKKNKQLKVDIDEQVASSKDLNKELMSQLDTTDSIEKAVNSVLGVETLQVAVLENAKALSKNITDEKREELLLDQKALMVQGDASNAIKQQLGGLQSMVKGAKAFQLVMMTNPFLAIATAIIFIIKLMMDFAGAAMDTRKELGLSLGASIKLTAQTKALGFAAKAYGLDVENIKAAQTAIRGELGLSVQEAANLSLQFAKTAAFTGQNEQQLGKTLSIMESISDASREALLAQIETTGKMLELEGLSPGDIFKDVADNAEHFASFAKDGGANIFKAAAAAKKLGLNMDAVAGTTESLLDFESSIEKQMEASMLLGRQLNLDKARQLALTGDQEGMMKEVLKQVGGEAEFNKMNVIQRKALAESVGQSVENLSRLVRNQTATTTGQTVAKTKKDNTEELLTDHTSLFQSMNKSLKIMAD